MLKRTIRLCLAAVLAGMTGIAPYVAGRCVLGTSERPATSGMADMADMAAGGGMPTPDGATAPGHCGHGHHGCCGCLGPCAGTGFAAPPVADTRVALPVAPQAVPSAPAERGTAERAARLLPFANGPPSHLG